MNKNAKIYVAGHSGLAGSAITRCLEKNGYSNIVVQSHSDLDLCRQQETEDFFKQERPDYVFLAAAKVGGILANDTYRADFIYDNIAIASNIIHASYISGVKKLLNLGSSCIYPRLAPQPISEDSLLTGPLEPTNEPYAIAKIAAIKLCNAYNFQYGTNFISAMPTNRYGPGDNFDLETSHVLPAIIRKLHLGKCLENNDLDSLRRDMDKNPVRDINGSSTDVQILEVLKSYGIEKSGNTKITLWGDGSPLREFLYSADLADALLFLMERVDAPAMPMGFVNIGCGSDITIKGLAHMIKDIVGFRGEIVWDTAKPNGTPQKLLDVSEINRMGWEYRTSLKEGIEKSYRAYLQG